jgi:hypothetical protein
VRIISHIPAEAVDVLIEKSQIAAAPHIHKGKRWVDSIYSIMNFDERIGNCSWLLLFK